jgi:predicted  nucleic acid-binding Zn-ribbon protein
MDPIEAIEELTKRVEKLLNTSREAQARVDAARSDAELWKSKVTELEARIETLQSEGRAREERMQTAATRVKALLEQLPAEA